MVNYQPTCPSARLHNFTKITTEYLNIILKNVKNEGVPDYCNQKIIRNFQRYL